MSSFSAYLKWWNSVITGMDQVRPLGHTDCVFVCFLLLLLLFAWSERKPKEERGKKKKQSSVRIWATSIRDKLWCLGQSMFKTDHVGLSWYAVATVVIPKLVQESKTVSWALLGALSHLITNVKCGPIQQIYCYTNCWKSSCWPCISLRVRCWWCITFIGVGSKMSFWPHALHSESLLWVVEAEEGRLSKTQHAACTQIRSLSVLENDVTSYEWRVQAVITTGCTVRRVWFLVIQWVRLQDTQIITCYLDQFTQRYCALPFIPAGMSFLYETKPNKWLY